MLITVTNLTDHPINYADSIDTASYLPGNPAGLVAIGGNIRYPLPYPFSGAGELEASGGADAIQRAMHVADLRRAHNMHSAFAPGEEWQQLVQAGIVSLAAAAETGRTDIEEELFGTI